jgi:cobalamin biosynthesis protein CobT
MATDIFGAPLKRRSLIDRSKQVQVGGRREPYVDATAVAAIHTVFSRSRLSHQAWQARQDYGRLDSRSAWRADAKGASDIFRERRLPSPTKLNVHLLVDASGSMLGNRACRAQDMAATIVKAFERIPTVRIGVWQHHAGGDECALYRVIEPGAPNKLPDMLENIGGGNADGFALQWVGERAAKAARPDERTLVIVISDGLPSVRGAGARAPILDHSTLVANTLRNKGVDVMSVAIAGDDAAHKYMYGERNVVNFTGDWAQLARDFASTFLPRHSSDQIPSP